MPLIWSRIPGEIQGVQGRMPYAAASQQPSTCELWHALVYTRAGDGVYPAVLLKVYFSRTAAFPKVHLPCRRRQKWRKKRTFITHHYSGYKSGIKNCEKRLICFYNSPSRFCLRSIRVLALPKTSLVHHKNLTARSEVVPVLLCLMQISIYTPHSLTVL